MHLIGVQLLACYLLWQVDCCLSARLLSVNPCFCHVTSICSVEIISMGTLLHLFNAI